MKTSIEETEENPLYYYKQDSGNYIISFGAGVGESVTYHSKTQQWEDY